MSIRACTNLILGISAIVLLLTACAQSPPTDSSGAAPTTKGRDAGDPRFPGVNTVSYDRSGWQSLLGDHTKIRRTLWHAEKDGIGTVESLTESDDPAVAANITEHAIAMQKRMKSGATVRVWDSVFAELFEKYKEVSLEVTPTAKGVKIVETSADASAVSLFRAHAMGVSEFVRSGHASSPLATPRFESAYPVGVLPVPEVALGGVPHRFLLSQPDAAQLAALKASGVTGIINFRKPSETETFNESAATAATGLEYCNLPYQGAAELTDDVLDATRESLLQADSRGQVVALHCRSGNRVGPGWAAYRVLDAGVPLEQAMNEAKAIGMKDPAIEARAREYIVRRLAPETK